MPPAVSVKLLQTLAQEQLAKSLLTVFTVCETKVQINRKEGLQELCRRLPGIVLEALLVSCCEQLVAALKEDRSHLGLPTTLACLLHPQVTKLDIGDLFLRIRLPNRVTNDCLSVLTLSLPRLSLLTSLILLSKCSDDVLSLITKHCTLLKELDVSYSNISDSGLETLASSDLMKKLETLGINKCWDTTVGGVAQLFENKNVLQHLLYDQMGDVFTLLYSKCPNERFPFFLEEFEQTLSAFTPPDGLISYIVQRCPYINTVRTISEDVFIPLYGGFCQLKSVNVEVCGSAGFGIKRFIEDKGKQLESLFLNFDDLNCHTLAAVFQYCPNLRRFRLLCKSLEQTKLLEGIKVRFDQLEVLELSWWGEPLPKHVMELLLTGSRNYQRLLLGGEVPYFTDSYFKTIFSPDSFNKLEVLLIESAPDIPLTIKSVKHICRICPALKRLGIKWWNISAPELQKLHREIRDKNWDLSIN